MPQPTITKIFLKITYLKFPSGQWVKPLNCYAWNPSFWIKKRQQIISKCDGVNTFLPRMILVACPIYWWLSAKLQYLKYISMELLQSCTKPLKCNQHLHLQCRKISVCFDWKTKKKLNVNLPGIFHDCYVSCGCLDTHDCGHLGKHAIIWTNIDWSSIRSHDIIWGHYHKNIWRNNR